MPRTFHKGEQVKVVQPDLFIKKLEGAIGKIVEISQKHSPSCYTVELPELGLLRFASSELDLVAPHN